MYRGLHTHAYSLISGFPRVIDGPVHRLVSWSKSPLSPPFSHVVGFCYWFSLSLLISPVHHFYETTSYDRLLRKALGLQVIVKGHRTVATSYWMAGITALQFLATDFSLTPSWCHTVWVSKSTTLRFSFSPFLSSLPKNSCVSLCFFISQAQNSFPVGFRASPLSLFLFLSSHLASA